MTMQPMIDAAETNDFDQVMKDPAAWYRAPQAVLDDKQLRRTEKQALLAEWARDLADRAAAADEGMVPDEPRIIDRDVRMHDQVVAAQAELDALAAEDAGLSFTQRLWRRITSAD